MAKQPLTVNEQTLENLPLISASASNMTAIDELDRAAKQTANHYIGGFAWPTVILGLSLTLAYLFLPVFIASGDLGLALAIPLAIVITYASYTVMHDAAHGSISGSHGSLRWINELMGYCAGFVLMIPLTAHRHEHLAHHRNTNNADEDPDYVVRNMAKSPFHAASAAARIVSGQYTYYLKNRWAKDPVQQRFRFGLEIFVSVAARFYFMAQGFWLEGAALFIVGGVGGIALLMYLFAYIVHAPHDQVGRYKDTATFVFPKYIDGIVTTLWGFQNYHSIHHLFPRVPFYKYRELFRKIRPIMEKRGAPIYQF